MSFGEETTASLCLSLLLRSKIGQIFNRWQTCREWLRLIDSNYYVSAGIPKLEDADAARREREGFTHNLAIFEGR